MYHFCQSVLGYIEKRIKRGMALRLGGPSSGEGDSLGKKKKKRQLWAVSKDLEPLRSGCICAYA